MEGSEGAVMTVRSFNLDDDVIEKLDKMRWGERSRWVNETLRTGLKGTVKEVAAQVDERYIRKIIREELQGLDIKEKPAEKVSEDIQEKVKKSMGSILKMREG